MLVHWFLCFWGNLAGSLFVMAIIFGCTCHIHGFHLPAFPLLTVSCVPDGGVFETDPYLTAAQNFVHKKQAVPTFLQIFLRAIGCNWLVCLACFIGMQGRDLASKIIGIWWPIFAFASLGLDHVVANMFLIPMGIWLQTPDVTVALYIWKGTSTSSTRRSRLRTRHSLPKLTSSLSTGIIPAALGNMIGGAIFCGMYYWWMFIFREPPIRVDGVYYNQQRPGLPTVGNDQKDMEQQLRAMEFEQRSTSQGA